MQYLSYLFFCWSVQTTTVNYVVKNISIIIIWNLNEIEIQKLYRCGFCYNMLKRTRPGLMHDSTDYIISNTSH